MLVELGGLGKVLGGGMNLGAICGAAKYVDLTIGTGNRKSVPLASTHTASPISLAAGCAQLDVLLADVDGSYGHLNRLGNRLRDGLQSTLAEAGVRAFVTGMGSLWNIHFTAEAPRNLRDQSNANVMASKVLAAYLLLEGVLVSAPMHLGYLSTSHSDADIDFVLDAHRKAFVRMRDDGWLER